MSLTFASIAKLIGIRGFIAIGFAVALGIAIWRIDALSGKLDAEHDKLIREQTAHAVTKSSLDSCVAQSEAYVKAGQERQKAAQEAIQAQKKRSEALDQQISWIRSERASTPKDAACKTPQSVMQADGL